MKAAICQEAAFSVADLPDPVPAKGQLVLDVLRCGICGSDLHARHHADEMADVAAEVGYDAMMRRSQAVVLGHEFIGEVVDRGPATRGPRSGTRVVSFPLVRRGKLVHTTGLSADAPGGYAERVLVEESLSLPVPNGLSTEVAALTEPMAVGLHAVRRSGIGKGQVAIVIGCGPVGLAVISMLKASGVRTVVASDFSAGRRALAHSCGADVIVDPAHESPYEVRSRGHLTEASQIFDLAVNAMDKLTRVPQWWHLYRAAEAVGATNPKHPVVFECVGVPGIIDQIISRAPLASRVVVVGVCMEPDRVRPAMAINKEIDLRFVLGYTPLEFRDSLHLLADGKINAEPILTGVVGLAGIESAFTALGDPETHAKILIDPRSDAATPQPVTAGG